MDYLSDLESNLANFTGKLYQGINEIQQQAAKLEPSERAKLVSSYSAQLVEAHQGIISSISKLPDELFSQTKEQQEGEIKTLQLQYEQAVERLEKLQKKAKIVNECVQESLDAL
ncbi:unnamed protein product [Blepharisma stoltei]|uniref:Mediator of RNA polymerase II transcription subunit 21 n=1 Tax=Blepharisma stoltei TaxID=1481888 RepID=A0AAU9IJS2_9CILI|nr:unnamed protein product [Blepharisma stoltei]